LRGGGGGRVVPSFWLHHAEAVEGVGLAERVTSLAVQRQCPGQAGGGGRVVPGLLLQDAQPGERVGLAEPVAAPARRDEGALLEGGGLIPVATGGQEAAHRGRYGRGG